MGTITQRDANGFVVGIRQPKATGSAAQAPDGSLAAALTNQATQATSNDARYDRTFVNDANGTAVFVSQGGFNDKTEVNSSIANPASGYQGGVTGSALTPGHVQRQLVANGEVLARYGDAPTQEENTPQTNNPAYVDTADFRLQAAQIRPRHKSLDPVAYTVVGGETLKDIARNVLGDASLWWRIADANSLAVSGDGQLTAGQTLTVPKLSLNANGVETFQPYDPSQATGSMDPVLPVPANGGGCGGVGQIIMIVVAVVAAYFTAGAAAELLGAAFAPAAGAVGVTVGSTTLTATGAFIASAIGGAVGSIASQAVGIAIGAQSDFSWKGVALSALGGGISSGLAGTQLLHGSDFGVSVARAAVGNALSQGIGVVTGLQDRFDWRSVAASAAGAGVAWGMNNALGLTDAKGERIAQPINTEMVAKATLSGFAAGLTTAVARGGRVSVQQIATDAFGNAIGGAFADKMSAQARELKYRESTAFNDSKDGYFQVPENMSAYRTEFVKYPSIQVADASDLIPAGDRTVIQSDSSAPNSAWTEGQEKALEEIVIKAKRIVGPIGDEVGATMGASLLLPASVIHGATQFASDQVWTSLNLLTGNVLAEKNSSARDAVARNNALVQSLVALPQKASAMALRAMTGNWRGMEPLNLDQVNALNARGDSLGAKVLFGQSALNVIAVGTGVAGIARSGIWAGSSARAGTILPASESVGTNIGAAPKISSQFGNVEFNRPYTASLDSGLPPGLNPVPENKLALWADYLTKRGVKLEIGTDEAYRVLNERGAQGLFMKELVDIDTNAFRRTIYLPENPNASVFYEEGLHALDSLKGRPSRMDVNGINIDAYEYRAKSILLDASPKRFTYEEFKELGQHLELVKQNRYGN
ncbi:LysM peptidoglycan-binding domain-containing protein [Paracidovorax cattleyae]|uniref:LysM peptidoglycan-binding domain-containing protein n=1 Tax=Paracidovorax cattleyae TaxID=80868 RepID=UPI0014288B73|nr:LysM domain-containing protein [Paracidovorax cattleyae]